MAAQDVSPDTPVAPPPNGTYSNFIDPPSLHASTVAVGVTTMVLLTVLVGVQNPPPKLFSLLTRAQFHQVVLILEELGVPYEFEIVHFENIKKQPFTTINPNGRSPAIIDPNTDITLWESGAIVQYFVKEYDVDNRLSYNTLKEHHLCTQWLMFQMSGQGPYFGQCTWFRYLHPERIPSAVERYADEIQRVFSVLETALTSASEAGSQWLVGDRITFADFAFVPWNEITGMILGIGKDQRFEGFPRVEAWHARMGLGEDGMPKDSSQKLTEYIANPAGKELSGDE
ncbi:glutathione S-transferase [Xylaria sp. FL1777]|nr:glutathione S-transferase [Xylaria sp. FL1777]